MHDNNFNKAVMKDAINYAKITSKDRIGGPFGAAIVKDGEVVCIESNRVLADKDPTAHAEVTAIRAACKKLGTHDLSGCVLYATGYPCPMCLSAAIWANIKEVYYCNDLTAAENIGFRDDHIYTYIKEGCDNSEVLHIKHLPLAEGQELMDEYANRKREIY